MSSQDLNMMTPLEREFTNNPDNFPSHDDYKKHVGYVQKGDDEHKKGNFLYEATNHRLVQERIYKLGFDKERDDSRHDYSWNSLYMHSDITISGLLDGGMTFDNAFTYDKNNHRYFLTKAGKNYCDTFGVSYHGPKNKSANLVSNAIEYDSPSQSRISTTPSSYNHSSNNYYGRTGSSGYTTNKYGSTVSYGKTAKPVYSDEVEMFVG